jgi:MFS family permease
MTRPSQVSPLADAAPRSLLRHRSFVLFWCARTSTTAAYQMLAVAVGWQIYDMTNNPLDLGIAGLVQFFPVVVLSLLIGQIADRYDRRAVVRACQIAKALSAALLALGTAGGWLTREVMFAILFVIGIARAFELPTLHVLVPSIVPASILSRAIAASATAQQTAIICGPALGGFLYALGATIVYWSCAAVFVLAAVLVSLVQTAMAKQDRKPVSFETVFAGYGYVRRREVLLGVMSLDLFTVLLSGVTALLPIFARDILQTGPSGLGLLRSAPAVGALVVSAVLARHTISRHAGYMLFASVAVYGLSSFVFGLSTSVGLSFVALVVLGASDAISVVIRHSLVQSRTPNEMLGRVMAINSMFSGSSGTLGEFRAGAIAAWLGPVSSALFGAAGALIVTVLWMFVLFPELTRIDSLSPDQPTKS